MQPCGKAANTKISIFPFIDEKKRVVGNICRFFMCHLK